MMLEAMRKRYLESRSSDNPIVAMTSQEVRASILHFCNVDLTSVQLNNAIQSSKVNREIEKFDEIHVSNGGKGKIRQNKFRWASREVLEMFEVDSAPMAAEVKPESVRPEIRPNGPNVPNEPSEPNAGEERLMTRAEKKRARNNNPAPVIPVQRGEKSDWEVHAGIDLRELRREIHELQKDVASISASLGSDFIGNIRKIADQQYQVVAELKTMRETGSQLDVKDVEAIGVLLSNILSQFKNAEEVSLVEKVQAKVEGIYSRGFREGWDQYAKVLNALDVKPQQMPSSKKATVIIGGGKLDVDFSGDGIDPGDSLADKLSEMFAEKPKRPNAYKFTTDDENELPDWARMIFVRIASAFGKKYGEVLAHKMIEDVKAIEVEEKSDGSRRMAIHAANGKVIEIPVISPALIDNLLRGI